MIERIEQLRARAEKEIAAAGSGATLEELHAACAEVSAAISVPVRPGTAEVVRAWMAAELMETMVEGVMAWIWPEVSAAACAVDRPAQSDPVSEWICDVVRMPTCAADRFVRIDVMPNPFSGTEQSQRLPQQSWRPTYGPPWSSVCCPLTLGSSGIGVAIRAGLPDRAASRVDGELRLDADAFEA